MTDLLDRLKTAVAEVTEAYARLIGHLLRVDQEDRQRKEQIRGHLDAGFASSCS